MAAVRRSVRLSVHMGELPPGTMEYSAEAQRDLERERVSRTSACIFCIDQKNKNSFEEQLTNATGQAGVEGQERLARTPCARAIP